MSAALNFMANSSTQKPRFAPDFVDGRPIIKDTQHPRFAPFLEEIELKGLDPEYLSWKPLNHP